ncbi:MAG: hypothetical protein ACOC22_01815 [bacterium]
MSDLKKLDKDFKRIRKLLKKKKYEEFEIEFAEFKKNLTAELKNVEDPTIINKLKVMEKIIVQFEKNYKEMKKLSEEWQKVN